MAQPSYETYNKCKIIARIAAANGKIDVLQWLTNGEPNNCFTATHYQICVDYAIQFGQIPFIKWLMTYDTSYDFVSINCILACIRHQQLNLLCLLITTAAANGIADWNTRYDKTQLITAAIQSNSLVIVEYIYRIFELQGTITESIVYEAIKADFSIYTFIVQQSCSLSIDKNLLLKAAIKSGRTKNFVEIWNSIREKDPLIFARIMKSGTWMMVTICNSVFAESYENCVRKDPEFISKSLLYAIKRRCLDSVKLLTQCMGSTSSTDYTYWASKVNCMDILRWLHESGFALHPMIIEEAIRNTNRSMLKWAIDHHIGITSNCLHIAALKNDVEVIEWISCCQPDLVSRTTDSDILELFTTGAYDAIKWFNSHNHLLNQWIINGLVEIAHLDSLVWIHLKFTELKWESNTVCVMKILTVINSLISQEIDAHTNRTICEDISTSDELWIHNSSGISTSDEL